MQQYEEGYSNLLGVLQKSGMVGLARSQCIREFNTRFYNAKYYADGHRSPLLLEQEPDRSTVSPLFRDVVQFALYSGVYKTLGLSVADLLQLDLHSYTIIREVMEEENRKKDAVLDKEMRDQQQRKQEQQALRR